jgi:hypothetical protein
MDEKRRQGIEDADDSGLVAGEELITQATTMLPLEQLHAALPGHHQAHARIDQLHAEMGKDSPSRQAIEQHVHHLRLLPELEAIVVNWWNDPKTQRFFENLGQIGV